LTPLLAGKSCGPGDSEGNNNRIETVRGMMELVIAKTWVNIFKNIGPGVLIGQVKVGAYVVGGSYLIYLSGKK